MWPSIISAGLIERQSEISYNAFVKETQWNWINSFVKNSIGKAKLKGGFFNWWKIEINFRCPSNIHKTLFWSDLHFPGRTRGACRTNFFPSISNRWPQACREMIKWSSVLHIGCKDQPLKDVSCILKIRLGGLVIEPVYSYVDWWVWIEHFNIPDLRVEKIQWTIFPIPKMGNIQTKG